MTAWNEDKRDQKKQQQISVFGLKFKATWSFSALLKLRNPAVFSAKLFLVVSPYIIAHLSDHSLWEGLGWQNFQTKILHVFATGYTNSRWKHHCAAWIFLAAGRQLTGRLTLQGSSVRWFSSGASDFQEQSEVKAEKIVLVGCFE